MVPRSVLDRWVEGLWPADQTGQGRSPTKVKGGYNNTEIGVSAEFGRKIKLKDDYFVEPYGQLSIVSIP